jgi:replicative DNA helicase
MASDLHDQGGAAAEAPVLRTMPHNLRAELAVLGAILVNNEVYHRISDFLTADDFYEPVHRRIYAACAETIARGQLADHTTLYHLFDTDPALAELDGGDYLGRIARAAEAIVDAVAYARVVHDLAVRRRLIGIGEEIVNDAFDPANPESGLEQIEKAEQKLFELAQRGESRGDFRRFPDVLESAVRYIHAAYHKSGHVTGVPTGLVGLDEKLGGLQRSDLIVLAARPSMGKTALALTIAANAAAKKAAGPEAAGLKHENYVVGLFSLEMSAEQLAMRLLSAEARIPTDELRRGRLQEEDFHRIVRATQELAARPLFIDDTPALSIAALRSRARRLKRTHGLSLLIVDYLQLLRGVGQHAQQNRVHEISEISQGLKAIAKELDVPVLALSQLSRAVEAREDKRPQLSDLRESGSIEQDADVVMFVYRDEYYQSRAEPKQRPDESNERFQERYERWKQRLEESHNKAEVIVAKQRNGPIGLVHLQFDARFGRFYDLETAHYPEPWGTR